MPIAEDAALPSPKSARRAALAMTALPVLSVGVAVLVILGPASAREVLAARVYGAPAPRASRLAIRIQAVRSLFDVVEPAGEREILVEATAPGQTLRAFHGATGPDGAADVGLDASTPLEGPVALVITALGEHRTTLAAGEIRLESAPVAKMARALVPGVASGPLAIEVIATRGLLAAPYPETLRVHVAGSARVALEISATGADVTPSRVAADEQGNAHVTVRPMAHEVDLAITARTPRDVLPDLAGKWEGRLPVAPGAMWLSPSDGAKRRISAPSPRPRAYVSFWSAEGRVGGAIVPLARDDQGFYAGDVDEPSGRAPTPDVALFASVASDLEERGPSTVAWPLASAPPEALAKSAPLALLLDGLPAAQGREHARAAKVRRIGGALIVAAAIAEIFLLVAHARGSQRRLDAHLQRVSSDVLREDRVALLAAGRERPLLRVLVACSLVGLAFALIAALGTFR